MSSKMDRERISWLRAAVLVATFGLLCALGPVLWWVIKTGAGLLALCAFAGLGWLGLQALPHWGKLLEQRLLRARLAEARENPVEELISALVERSAQLERYRAALAAIAAQIEGMREMLAQRRAADPKHDTQKQAAALLKMQSFHTHHLGQLANAEAALIEYKRHLQVKRFEWSFAEAGRSVLNGLRASDRESIVRELLSDEATRAVQLSFDQVFASLEIELRQIELQDVQLPRLTQELQ
ncbi:MAG TPA: hypothetical protein VMF89_30870 [Polyangiales bacterium]|nr:hypothetical protein [Polyangiales bacterium]